MEKKRILLDQREMVVEDLEIGDGWVHLNHGMTGLYLVKFDDVLLKRISAALADGALTDELDRYQLLHGVNALCKAGELSATSLLTLLPSFKNETSQLVWESVVGACSSIFTLLDKEPEEEKFNAMLRDLLTNIKTKMGWEEIEGESSEDQMLRGDILKLCEKAGDQEVIKTATEKFWAFFKEGTKLPASLRQRIYVITAKHGGKDVYDALKARFKVNEDAGEVRDLICGMCLNKVPELHKDMLEFTFSDAIRKQDKVFTYAYMGMNQDAIETCWAYVSENWQKLYDFYEGGFLVNWLARVPQGFYTFEKADQVEKAYAAVREGSPCAQRAMDQTLESIRTAATWRERDLPKLKEFFANAEN